MKTSNIIDANIDPSRVPLAIGCQVDFAALIITLSDVCTRASYLWLLPSSQQEPESHNN